MINIHFSAVMASHKEMRHYDANLSTGPLKTSDQSVKVLWILLSDCGLKLFHFRPVLKFVIVVPFYSGKKIVLVAT